MLTVYLVRHAQTEWNAQGIVQGWKDSPLTKDGAEKAELLGRRLKEIPLDAVYASPTERAVKTAEIVSGLPAASIRKDEGLMELNYGSWDGRRAADIQKKKKQK
nr:histidine phosphatase family protein [Sinobaca sp. H24]